jgi:hypothetical protein
VTRRGGGGGRVFWKSVRLIFFFNGKWRKRGVAVYFLLRSKDDGIVDFMSK